MSSILSDSWTYASSFALHFRFIHELVSNFYFYLFNFVCSLSCHFVICTFRFMNICFLFYMSLPFHPWTCIFLLHFLVLSIDIFNFLSVLPFAQGSIGTRGTCISNVELCLYSPSESIFTLHFFFSSSVPFLAVLPIFRLFFHPFTVELSRWTAFYPLMYCTVLYCAVPYPSQK